MEGLANYGSDDEIDGPPIAADQRNIKIHHKNRNEFKEADVRHHSRSSSSDLDQKYAIEDENRSRPQSSIRERKSDYRYKTKETEHEKYRVKTSRDQAYKSERYHKSDRNRERNYREKRDHDFKKDSAREKRYHDDREGRHYKSRDERRYDERSDRTNGMNDRYKRAHENEKHHREYKKRKEFSPKKNDDHRDRSERYEKRYRDDDKDDKYNRKDNHSAYENLSSRNREKYNKTGTPPGTSAEQHPSYSHSRSRTPTRHANSNHVVEQKSSYKWHAEDNDMSKQIRKTEQTIAMSLPTTKAPAPVVPVQTQVSSAIPLPNYYNPSVVNVNKYAEQVQKRKLLWSGKKAEDNASKWGKPQFSEDSDGKVASKFLRLMGIKNSDNNESAKDKQDPNVQSREEMFSSMEQQYEVARQVTHTMRGVGLGFSSQSRPF